MNQLEKILRCHQNGALPKMLWRHHPKEEFCNQAFIDATVAFYTQHAFDIVKITPSSAFSIRDCGCLMNGHSEPFGGTLYRPSLLHAKNWLSHSILDPTQGFLGQHAYCVQKIAEGLGRSRPILQTIFTPLAQAINLTGGVDLLLSQLQHMPEAVWHGISVLAESTKLFIAHISPWIEGICYAIQENPVLHRFPHDFKEKYHAMNQAILKSVSGIKMLHLHNQITQFDIFCTYPVDILHWDEYLSRISLEGGKRKFPGIVSGGISWPPQGWESVEQIERACLSAYERIGCDRFILSAGCVIPYQTPVEHIHAFEASLMSLAL